MYLEVPAHIEALGLDFTRLWHDLTAFPTREEAADKIRIYSARTLANLDSKGRGPAGRLKIANKVCYPKDELVMWYAAQTKKAVRGGHDTYQFRGLSVPGRKRPGELYAGHATRRRL